MPIQPEKAAALPLEIHFTKEYRYRLRGSDSIDGRDARSFASQGQQRTAVVSLKLGEAAVVTQRTGEPPVLLLDDVLSELDAGRRAALLGHLASAGQVIITSVEADPFPRDVIGRSLVRCIKEGEVISCG